MAMTFDEIKALAEQNHQRLQRLLQMGMQISTDPVQMVRLECISEHLGLEEQVHTKVRELIDEIEAQLPEIERQQREAMARQALLNPLNGGPPF